MDLKKFDNKCVRIIDIDDIVFEGNCTYNDKEYNEHEYGRNDESLQILNIIFYKEFVKEVEVIKSFTNEYGNLEELIIDTDIDFIEDAFEYNDKVHNNRLMLCLKDNIDKFDDKDRINKLIEKKN